MKAADVTQRVEKDRSDAMALAVTATPEYFVSITAVQPSTHLDLESHLVMITFTFKFTYASSNFYLNF